LDTTPPLVCKHCGATNEPDVLCCFVCDHSLSREEPSADILTPVRAPKRLSVRSAIQIGLIAFVCFMIGGGLGDWIGTAHTYATFQGDATATVEARVGATATAAQALALSDPYPPHGALVLVDPLNQSGGWQEGSNSDNEGCWFRNGGLQMKEVPVNRFINCDESALYQNFAMQVDMTITQGDCGGISFRDHESADGTFQSYDFNVCANGKYGFEVHAFNDNKPAVTNFFTSLIKTGPQANTIAVVASGVHFDFYINGQKVSSAEDSAYDMGTLGLIAGANDQATTVLYRNAIIWSLSIGKNAQSK